MTEKQDHIGLCNEFGVTASEFEAQFCFRCLQKECARSQHGKSRFEARIGSWEERLFTQVPKMSEGDPRFVTLRAKKFVEIDAGRVPEIGQPRSAWVDPRDLDEAPESPQSTGSSERPSSRRPSEPPVAELVPAAPPQPSGPAGAAEPEPLETPAADPPPRTEPTPFLNTPVQQGRMIGGYKPKQNVQQDPWELKPAKETQGLPVVKPGARIKLGGSGV